MIETRALKKSFGPQLILDGVDLRIETGESVVIIGRSGGGKSVLLKHLIGLLVREKFGMVFQGAALFDSMTVAENVAFPLERKGKFTAGEIDKRVSAALDMVDLPGTQKKKPAELSGGMRKRVGLARAIVYEPQIVIYDEPTTGLDPIMSDCIDQLIIRVRDQLKVTSVVVTHDMRSARRVGNHVMLLHERKIYVHGTPEEIFNSQDAIVRQFIDGVADAKENLVY